MGQNNALQNGDGTALPARYQSFSLYSGQLSAPAVWLHFNKQIIEVNNANQGRDGITKRITGGRKHTAVCLMQDFLKAHRYGQVYQDEWYETSTALTVARTGFPRRTVADHIERLLAIGFIMAKAEELPGIPKARPGNFFLKINTRFYLPQKRPEEPP